MFMNFDFISDEEEEVFDFVPPPRRPKLIRPRINPIDVWDEPEFFQRFRLSKASVNDILAEILPALQNSGRNDAVSPMNKLLMTLRFYATGSFFMEIGDFIGPEKSTTMRHIWSTTQAIVGLRQQHIYMPRNDAEVAQMRDRYYNMARFPRVIGVVDGTFIRLQSPGGDDAETFRNRKQYFAKNVQVVGGPSLEIQNIVTRWPGSAHDQTVFNASNIAHRLEAGEWGNHWILGDTGYECRPHILVPLPQTNSAAENLYNESFVRTRQSVERLIGVWKRRFPILSTGIRVTKETLQKTDFYIVACAILHNIAIRNNEPEPPVDPAVPVLPDIDVQQNPVNVNHRTAARTALIDNYFTNLLL